MKLESVSRAGLISAGERPPSSSGIVARLWLLLDAAAALHSTETQIINQSCVSMRLCASSFYFAKGKSSSLKCWKDLGNHG